MVAVADRAVGRSSEDLSAILAVLSAVVTSPAIIAAQPLDTLTDLGVDSLGLIQFVAALEQRFGIRFAEDDLESFGTATLSEVARLVSGKSEAGGGRAETTLPEVSAPEPGRRLTVRGYREADRAALRRICIEASSLGALGSLAPVFFLDQYCDDDPSSCFVAEFDGEVVGYWVGTRDVVRLRRGVLAHTMRRLGEILGTYRRAWPALSWAEHKWFWRQVLRERTPSRHSVLIARQLGELFARTDFHFQLEPTKAPAGTIFALAHAWLEHLRAHGLQGTVLPSVPGGPPAMDMWKRLGFTPLEVTLPNGSRLTWLLAIL
jgi:acyl carrier protein